MNKVEIELDTAGVSLLLKSEELKNACEKIAQRAKRKLGDGYEVTTFTGATRVNASIAAKTAKAKNENLKDNRILKSLGG